MILATSALSVGVAVRSGVREIQVISSLLAHRIEAETGAPADPGQLAWLDAGLSALGGTGMGERDKLAAVLAVLHFARGAAALAIEAPADAPDYPGVLRGVVGADQFPALASALAAGAFDDGDESHAGEFRSGLDQLLDGISLKV